MDESDVKRLTEELERLPIRAVVAFAYWCSETVAPLAYQVETVGNPRLLGASSVLENARELALKFCSSDDLSSDDTSEAAHRQVDSRNLHARSIERTSYEESENSRKAVLHAISSSARLVECAFPALWFVRSHQDPSMKKEVVENAIECAMQAQGAALVLGHSLAEVIAKYSADASELWNNDPNEPGQAKGVSELKARLTRPEWLDFPRFGA